MYTGWKIAGPDKGGNRLQKKGIAMIRELYKQDPDVSFWGCLIMELGFKSKAPDIR